MSESEANVRKRVRLSRRGFIAGSTAAAVSIASVGCSYAVRSRGISESDLVGLRERLDGRLVLPVDPAYETARRVVSHNPDTDVTPVAIVYCRSRSDIARGIEFSRVQDLPLSIRSGGCDILGRSTNANGVVIDLSELNSVTSSDDRDQVSIGAGARAGHIDGALAQIEKAVPLGCDPMVGIGGLASGGGLGWLAGRYGATCDSMVSANLVTADGDFVVASAEENPDLLWALKGGGGNFGVISSMTFETIDLSTVIGGYLVYPLERMQDFLVAYPALMENASRELMVELAILDTARGPVLVAMTCHSGTAAAAAADLRPFRDVMRPIADDIGYRDYPSVGVPSAQTVDAFPAPENRQETREEPVDSYSRWRGCSLTDITPDAASIIIEAIREAPSGASFGLGHYMKGAAAEVTGDASAMPRRQGAMCAYFASQWTYSDRAAEHMLWTDQTNEALSNTAPAPTYINYLASARDSAVRRAYGGLYERLSNVKERWDPENVFRNNANIKPA